MKKEKKYTWKVYAIDWTFKFTIRPTDVKAPLVFESSLDWWQWQFNLVLNKSVDYNDIINTDIIRIYQIDTSNPDGRIIYAWIVQNIQKNINPAYEEIIIPLLWLWSVFTYKTYNGSLTDTPWNIVSLMIDTINTDYNLFTKNLYLWWTDIKLDNEYETCQKVLHKATKASTYKYRISASWEVRFQDKPATPIHQFQLWKEVTSLKMKTNTEKLVNKLILKYNINTKVYEDLTSQTTYWIKEKYIVDTSIKQNQSADEFWNTYITENKNPINEIIVEINDEYDIEIIKPWDTITIYDTIVQNLQIVKTKYNMDSITLYLEDFESFWNQFNYLNLQN